MLILTSSHVQVEGEVHLPCSHPCGHLGCNVTIPTEPAVWCACSQGNFNICPSTWGNKCQVVNTWEHMLEGKEAMSWSQKIQDSNLGSVGLCSPCNQEQTNIRSCVVGWPRKCYYLLPSLFSTWWHTWWPSSCRRSSSSSRSGSPPLSLAPGGLCSLLCLPPSSYHCVNSYPLLTAY